MINFESAPPDTVWKAIAAKLDDDKQYATLSSKMIDTKITPPESAWINIASQLDDDKQNTAAANKLKHFEVTPPPSAWETIAARLDNDKQYAAVAKKLNDFEATPPPSAWEAIVAKLDEDNQYATVATKLNSFEVVPPRSAWSNISARLNEENQHESVAAKLKNFEAAPPPQIWNNIAEALTETTPVINISRTIYRMAAAAILIGLVIGSWLFVNKSTKTDFAKNNQKLIPATTAATEKNENISVNNAASQKTQEIASLTKTAKNNRQQRNSAIVSMIDPNNNAELKHAVVNDLFTYQEKPIVIHSSPILDREGNVIADMDVLTTSNYIVVMGPNGQTTRISSKFASVIRFLNANGDDNAGTEEYLDKVIKESDTWKKRFQEWRSRISQSSFIPSSSNFLDIVEFKELIQEKQ